MSVRFLLGRAGTGKTSFIVNEIQQKLEEKPNGNPIIYIVPDQMSFTSEYKLINTSTLKGMIRAQVFSFTRLAWKILQETGGMNRYHLTSSGLNMLIRKIIEDNKDQLKIFTKAADKTGFVGHVETMLTEFKRYCVSPSELVDFQGNLTGGSHSKVLEDKLHDLELIYSKFEETLVGKYIDSEDYFKLLAENIKESPSMAATEIYIDGFHSFTPQEYIIIDQLIRHGYNVSIALTVDGEKRNIGQQDDLSLFRMTEETYTKISDLIKRSNVERGEDVHFNQPIRFYDRGLKHLESYFDTRPIPAFQDTTNISIMESANRRAEVEGIAREIRSLARTKDYRYKDIAILVRNVQDYRDIMDTVFYDFDIPFFLDQKRTMLNHPLIELIRSTFEIINSKWRYEPVFRAVKTDLLFPYNKHPQSLREQMDRLENYVLAYGVQGDRWLKKDRWKYRRFRGLEHADVPQTDREKAIEKEINELRLFISAPILRLARRLKKQKTGCEYCEALYLYLEELDIPAKLERLRLQAEERGDLLLAREHDQAWAAVMDLLDQFVEMLGEEELDLKKYSSILDAGMESMKFSLVPPAVDQVLVADLEKSRLSDIKAAFVIGVNDGILPAKLTDEGVFSEEDRERLLQMGMNIGATSRTKLLDEEFLAYKAFTTPSEHLYISYPIANEEGKALLPSLYIKRMKELFPKVPLKLFVNDPSELSEQEQLEFVSHPSVSMSYLTSQLQLKKRQYPIYDLWWDVYNFYVTQEGWRSRAKHVLSSLFYENRAVKLSEDTSRDLYGEHILASVSRMELFHGCPFSHFASHGLKLREREMFRLEAPDIGEMFHAALKWISDKVQELNMTWSDLTKAQCIQLSKDAVKALAPKLQHQILLSSNRYHYITKKLEKIISRTSLILSEHAKASGFAPIGVELGFGPNGTLPPFQFTLKNGTKMELQGRIDRVDKAEDSKGVYLRVVDYKSSTRDLDINEVYHGLALQMLTYLDIVLMNSQKLVGKQAFPAGILYFHVHNPMINSTKILTLDEIENEIFKSFKMKGLVLGDTDIVRLMDQTLDSGSSDIIAAGIKQDGNLSSRSKVATQEQFHLMSKRVRHLYEHAGDAITSGATDISPYKLKDRTPCQFCSYKPVCQFDQSLVENEYRNIIVEKPDALFEKMREEGNDAK